MNKEFIKEMFKHFGNYHKKDLNKHTIFKFNTITIFLKSAKIFQRNFTNILMLIWKNKISKYYGSFYQKQTNKKPYT